MYCRKRLDWPLITHTHGHPTERTREGKGEREAWWCGGLWCAHVLFARLFVCFLARLFACVCVKLSSVHLSVQLFVPVCPPPPPLFVSAQCDALCAGEDDVEAHANLSVALHIEVQASHTPGRVSNREDLCQRRWDGGNKAGKRGRKAGAPAYRIVILS